VFARAPVLRRAAVFSIVNGVLIQALPYQNPDALVTMFEKVPGAPVDKFEFSAPDFGIVRDAVRSYSGMAAFRNVTYELSGIAQPQRLVGAKVSPELFGVLGVSPAIGRGLTLANVLNDILGVLRPPGGYDIGAYQ